MLESHLEALHNFTLKKLSFAYHSRHEFEDYPLNIPKRKGRKGNSIENIFWLLHQ
jgi:hypothetical protein